MVRTLRVVDVKVPFRVDGKAHGNKRTLRDHSIQIGCINGEANVLVLGSVLIVFCWGCARRRNDLYFILSEIIRPSAIYCRQLSIDVDIVKTVHIVTVHQPVVDDGLSLCDWREAVELLSLNIATQCGVHSVVAECVLDGSSLVVNLLDDLPNTIVTSSGKNLNRLYLRAHIVVRHDNRNGVICVKKSDVANPHISQVPRRNKDL